jgi:hypothetical protein
MGPLKKAASGVLAIFLCSRTTGTLRAQKWLWPCWTDFFEPTRGLWDPTCSRAFLPLDILIIQQSHYFRKPVNRNNPTQKPIHDALKAIKCSQASSFKTLIIRNPSCHFSDGKGDKK